MEIQPMAADDLAKREHVYGEKEGAKDGTFAAHHGLRLHAVNIRVKVNIPVSETFGITRLHA